MLQIWLLFYHMHNLSQRTLVAPESLLKVWGRDRFLLTCWILCVQVPMEIKWYPSLNFLPFTIPPAKLDYISCVDEYQFHLFVTIYAHSSTL